MNTAAKTYEISISRPATAEERATGRPYGLDKLGTVTARTAKAALTTFAARRGDRISFEGTRNAASSNHAQIVGGADAGRALFARAAR